MLLSGLLLFLLLVRLLHCFFCHLLSIQFGLLLLSLLLSPAGDDFIEQVLLHCNLVQFVLIHDNMLGRLSKDGSVRDRGQLRFTLNPFRSLALDAIELRMLRQNFGNERAFALALDAGQFFAAVPRSRGDWRMHDRIASCKGLNALLCAEIGGASVRLSVFIWRSWRSDGLQIIGIQVTLGPASMAGALGDDIVRHVLHFCNVGDN